MWQYDGLVWLLRCDGCNTVLLRLQPFESLPRGRPRKWCGECPENRSTVVPGR